jgi:hypothetical protein
MANKLYIGFGYKARHGKNFCADAIHQAFPADTKSIGFADALKAHCRVAFGMRAKDAPLLQMVGTDLYRRQHANLWVEVLHYTALESREPIILIPDVRFPNEAGFIKANGGVMVKVTRTTPSGIYIAPDRDPNHPSETALDTYTEWDAEIECEEGNLDGLSRAALWHFERLRRRR